MLICEAGDARRCYYDTSIETTLKLKRIDVYDSTTDLLQRTDIISRTNKIYSDRVEFKRLNLYIF